jgi:hypothetical protein
MTSFFNNRGGIDKGSLYLVVIMAILIFGSYTLVGGTLPTQFSEANYNPVSLSMPSNQPATSSLQMHTFYGVIPTPGLLQPNATACGPAPANSTKVATASELQSALNSKNPDITLTQSITTNNIDIPRTATGIILRFANDVVVTGNGWPVIKSTGSGGKLTLIDARVDSMNLTGEGNDLNTNYYLPDFDELTICRGMSYRSSRTGYFMINTNKLVVENNFVGWGPRDSYWTNDSKDVLIENSLIMHIGDDGFGSHTNPGQELLRSIIIRNNILWDALGIKVLGGSKDGTINGKPGQVLIENNKVYIAGFYGLRNGIDPATGEGNTTQRNISVKNNYVENVRTHFPKYPEQIYGNAYQMFAPGLTMVNVDVSGNIFKRVASAQGKTLAEAYPSYPQPIIDKLASINIPDQYKHFPAGVYTLNGFDANHKLQLTSSPWDVQANNPDAIIQSKNFIEGF